MNRGSDGADAQWECKATMDNEYQFGRIRVVCEGYEYPDDPYILKGSCGVSSVKLSLGRIFAFPFCEKLYDVFEAFMTKLEAILDVLYS